MFEMAQEKQMSICGYGDKEKIGYFVCLIICLLHKLQVGFSDVPEIYSKNPNNISLFKAAK